MLPAPARSIPVRRWLFQAAGIVPTLLLASAGFYALHREGALSRLEAKDQASRLAESHASRIARVALSLPLPSVADVAAWTARPGPPETEPLHRLAASAPDVTAWLEASRDSYPPSPSPLPEWEPPVPGSELDHLWNEARGLEAMDSRAPAALEAWESLALHAHGSPWETPFRYRFAAALVRQGRTLEAAPLLEAIVDSPIPAVGETGLPVAVLAARTALQTADIDPSMFSLYPSKYDHFCYLVHRWSLPSSLISDFRPPTPARPRDWIRVRRLHEKARAARDAAATSGIPTAVTWLDRPSKTSSLYVSSSVDGGVWHQIWTSNAVAASVNRVLADLGLPPHLGAEVRLLDRVVTPRLADSELLATASSRAPAGAALALSLYLASPELLDARRRQRFALFGSLVVLASVATIMAYLLALGAVERQRQFTTRQAEFVAAVTHELRAPLAAVRLLAEELVDLPPDEAPRRDEYHQLILREARRLGLLVDNVLRHARLERMGPDVEIAPVDLRHLVLQSMETLRPNAQERQVDLRVEASAEPVPTTADPHAIAQIVVNLVDNAIKHSPPRSSVEITLSRHPTPDSSGAVAILSVRDHGPGIPESDHHRIFEPFFRRGTELRRETQGVGLGLSIVRRLVVAHSGRIHVASHPGHGARFTVELPIVPQNSDATDPDQTSSPRCLTPSRSPSSVS